MTVSEKLAAYSLQALPRKQLSRALGAVAAMRAPQPMVTRAIQAFAKAYDVNLDEAEIPQGGFRTFDSFFTRTLKPGARQIEEQTGHLVSPADGALEDFGPIDDDAELRIKGRLYSAAELLGSQEAARQYRGGQYWIVYLSPRDYHRVHAPVDGDVTAVDYVPGTLFPVNRIGTENISKLFARNERMAIRQQSPTFGEVTTIMVGAIGVGRIGLSFDPVQTNRGHDAGVRRFDPGAVPRQRGEELGVFHLGSTAIVLLGPQKAVKPQGQRGDKVQMGMSLGSTGA